MTKCQYTTRSEWECAVETQHCSRGLNFIMDVNGDLLASGASLIKLQFLVLPWWLNVSVQEVAAWHKHIYAFFQQDSKVPSSKETWFVFLHFWGFFFLVTTGFSCLKLKLSFHNLAHDKAAETYTSAVTDESQPLLEYIKAYCKLHTSTLCKHTLDIFQLKSDPYSLTLLVWPQMLSVASICLITFR